MFSGVQQLITPITDLFGMFNNLAGGTTTLTDVILLAGEIVGGAFEFLGAVVGTLINGITWLVGSVANLVGKSEFLSNMFKSLSSGTATVIDTLRKYLSAEGFKAMLEGLTDGFMDMIDTIMNMIPDALGGLSDEEKKKRDEERKLRKEAREERLNTVLEEKNDKLKAAKEGVKADSAKFEQQKLHVNKMGGLQKEEEDAKKKATESTVKDYNDPLALLKGEAAQQKSGLIPAEVKNPKASSDLAGATKALESSASDKKKQEEADKKTAEEKAAGKSSTAGSGSFGGSKAAGQESAESLLASLNTKLDQLIKVNKDNKDLAEAQLSVQKGLTGNLLLSA
jgi:hypothetical protein